MFVLHRARIKKTVSISLVLLCSLVVFGNYYSSPNISSKRAREEAKCLEYFTNLERRSKNWSNDFYEKRWWDYLALGRREGDDVIENISRLRKFRECISENSGSNIPNLRDIETRLFPYLNFDGLSSDEENFWPVRTRWNGDVYKASTPRFSGNGDTYLDSLGIAYNKNISFWENWLQKVMQSGSRGIVLSIGQFQTADTIRLIRILRFLKNNLPIEVVHKGDLSPHHQSVLISAAREDLSDEYPGQELWFLDVTNMLNPQYSAKFTRYSNKWLALLFCSFEQPVLLDADTVPFTTFERYYQSERFKNSGTFFFKDRKLKSNPLKKKHLLAFNRIVTTLLGLHFPRKHSLHIFHTQLSLQLNDEISVETVESLLLKGHRHHMESGLVVINKRRHLFSLLASISLQFSSIQEEFHGDKDWFWFGQFLLDGEFTFHPVDASNVGKLRNVSLAEFQGELYQICSVQLSHTDVDGRMLWLNGGLNVCKKCSWDYDYKNNKRIAETFNNVNELQQYYQSPVELEGAVIPDVDKERWGYSGECAGFNYCTLYKQGEFGKVIKFSESEKQNYREFVRIWNLPVSF